MTFRRPERTLSRLVDTKTARLPYPRAGQVQGRNDDGTTRLRFLDAAGCEARLGITGARKGEVVLAEPSPLRSRGTAGVPTSSLIASRAAFWIERLERLELGDAEALDQLLAGEDVTVTVLGRGFTAATRFEFLRAESLETNPSIAILEHRFLDSEHVELDLSIDAEARELERAPLGATY